MEASLELCHTIYWDDEVQRPFQITQQDINFAKRLHVPLPSCFYIRRIKELYSHIYLSLEERTTQCAITEKTISTYLPEKLEGRIVSEEGYEQILQ